MRGGGASASQTCSSRRQSTPNTSSHDACQAAVASAQRETKLSIGREYLRAQHDFERRTEARPRPECETAVDRLRALADVLQALAGSRRLAVEPFAVVADCHDSLAETALADDHLGVRGVRVLADVAESFLNDSEHFDLLVRCKPDCRIDVELHRELPVRSEEVDVTSQRCVE